MTVTIGESRAEEPQGDTGARPPRGRVVMLVDNGVDGDSRVQKEARSAAAAGWDVTLLGITSPRASRVKWTIGEAKVELVKVPRPLAVHHSTMRLSIRRPFAYSSQAMAQSRLQAAAAIRDDVAFRRDLGTSSLALLPARVTGKGLHLWARFRAGQLTRLTNSRASTSSVVNRATVKFWKAVRGDKSWRRLDPSLWDYELGMAKTIDRLKPDIIHANDHRMLGVGARAKARAAARGRQIKLVWDAHEFVPGLPGLPNRPLWLPAQVSYEREHVRHADAITTVSIGLAELLRDEHKLSELPLVVMNCPDKMVTAPVVPSGALRADCGIDETTPLIVYCGGLSIPRNTILMVEALPDLPEDVHVAFVSIPPAGRRPLVDELRATARKLGVADRVHVLPYVAPDEVVGYLAAADVAVSPLLHLVNHEIALSNKFFEYSQARLPLITSDVRTMAETVRSTGQGAVYKAGDKADYARVVREVLADPAPYRAAYDKPGLLEEWSWDRQAAVLDKVYETLLPSGVPAQR